MLIYLADLAHTYTTKNESLMVPLNIGYLKAYAMEQHKDDINIKLFKDPKKLLACLDSENPDLVGLANYGWNTDLNTQAFSIRDLKKNFVIDKNISRNQLN